MNQQILSYIGLMVPFDRFHMCKSSVKAFSSTSVMFEERSHQLVFDWYRRIVHRNAWIRGDDFENDYDIRYQVYVELDYARMDANEYKPKEA